MHLKGAGENLSEPEVLFRWQAVETISEIVGFAKIHTCWSSPIHGPQSRQVHVVPGR